MKKAFTILACTAAMLLCGKAHAQLGVNFGYAPVTLSTETTIGNNTSTSSSELNGFFAGVNYNATITGNLGVSLGVQGRFNIKTSTGSSNFVVVSGDSKSTTTQFLVDVPVLLNYSLSLGSSAKLSPFVGPMVSYALTGNTHVKTTVTVAGSSKTSEDDYAMYGDNSNNQRLDLSLAFGASFQYLDFRVFGGYRMGLLDLNSNDNIKTTSAGIFLGLGYEL
ncbi:MAG: PorT family protein [Bacteroidales bacterium]|nr:PorT family protein [Bacteroidales bacterium]